MFLTGRAMAAVNRPMEIIGFPGRTPRQSESGALVWNRAREIRVGERATLSRRSRMGRALLLWIIGIPIPIILLVWLLGGFH